MDYSEYERLVEEFLSEGVWRELRKMAFSNWQATRDARLRGMSGHIHQIDVWIEIDLAGIAFKVVLECKYYARTVGVDEVMELAMRCEDLGANKGILVTTKGFQRGALKIAKAKGIALVVARDFERIEGKLDGRWDVHLPSMNVRDSIMSSWHTKRMWFQEVDRYFKWFFSLSEPSYLSRFSVEVDDMGKYSLIGDIPTPVIELIDRAPIDALGEFSPGKFGRYPYSSGMFGILCSDPNAFPVLHPNAPRRGLEIVGEREGKTYLTTLAFFCCLGTGLAFVTA